MASEEITKKPKRLVSLDAYRGFVMLLMASGGFAVARVVENHPRMVSQYDGTSYGIAWETFWNTAQYQLSHGAWTGCSLWDLIQPSFMFMVGVAMPFSYARRQAKGQSGIWRFGHVLARSMILVLLGVFLSSQWSRLTNFTFVNVLTQIGLGYPILYLLLGRRFVTQLVAVAAILGGYWYFFYSHSIPTADTEPLTQYIVEEKGLDSSEWTQFRGIAAHWNKHTNAAAAVDREFLNRFPRNEDEWEGRQFWINSGGYQTLNFIPSIATMIFGLMAGQLLRGKRSQKEKFQALVLGGAVCFLVSMAIDTTIWPITVPGCTWSFCPIVKRIWTPSWAVFSSGWTFTFLAMFYWVIDIKGYRTWAFPLAIVGMNSIAIYVMAQTMKGWISKILEIHLTTFDTVFHTFAAQYLFRDDYVFAPIWESAARLFVLWLICLWMYRRRLFIRI